MSMKHGSGVEAASPRAPSALLDLLLTLVLPSLVLESLSSPQRLGPVGALLLALLPPVAFMLYCRWRRFELQIFSSLGLVMVLVSGGLGLLEMSAPFFAAKEAALPLMLALAFPLSQRSRKPLTQELLLNAQVVNRPLLEQWLSGDARRRGSFDQLMHRASWALVAVMASSALLNAWMILWFIGEAKPGSEAFVKAIGRQNWAGLLVIGLPTTVALVVLLWWLFQQLERRLGLPRALLLRPQDRPAKAADRAGEGNP